MNANRWLKVLLFPVEIAASIGKPEPMGQVSEAELCSSSINGTWTVGRHKLAPMLNVDN